MSKRKKKVARKIGIEEYIKAVKKADREAELEAFSGWRRTTTVHANKKVYDRKRDKRSFKEE